MAAQLRRQTALAAFSELGRNGAKLVVAFVIRGKTRSYRVSLHCGGTEGNMTQLVEEEVSSGAQRPRFLQAMTEPGERLRSLARFSGRLDLEELVISSRKTALTSAPLRRLVVAALVETFGGRVQPPPETLGQRARKARVSPPRRRAR